MMIFHGPFTPALLFFHSEITKIGRLSQLIVQFRGHMQPLRGPHPLSLWCVYSFRSSWLEPWPHKANSVQIEAMDLPLTVFSAGSLCLCSFKPHLACSAHWTDCTMWTPRMTAVLVLTTVLGLAVTAPTPESGHPTRKCGIFFLII